MSAPCRQDRFCWCRQCKPPLSPIAQDEEQGRNAAMMAAAIATVGAGAVLGIGGFLFIAGMAHH